MSRRDIERAAARYAGAAVFCELARVLAAGRGDHDRAASWAEDRDAAVELYADALRRLAPVEAA